VWRSNPAFTPIPLHSGTEGRTVVALFPAIYRSQRLHRPIPFPLAAAEYSAEPAGTMRVHGYLFKKAARHVAGRTDSVPERL
jgi:hypothetical protein